jgi:death-on-curing protein
LAGVRDAAALEGALGRARNLQAYGKADLAALAAAYAHGVVKNHPFNDGNKRTAFLCAYVFLGLNGIEITMTEEQAVEVILALADGSMSQEDFASFLRGHSEPSPG